MAIFVEILFMIFCVVLFRVSMSKFCDLVDYKKKLYCVAGMMLAYTGSMIEMIYLMGEELAEMFTVKDFSIYVCILIAAMNLIVGGITILFCSTSRRRSLSNREKIMLKDM